VSVERILGPEQSRVKLIHCPIRGGGPIFPTLPFCARNHEIARDKSVETVYTGPNQDGLICLFRESVRTLGEVAFLEILTVFRLLSKETTMKRIALSVVVLCSFAIAAAYAADVKLDGVKCIVAGNNAAKADKTRDYRGGKVYFCCDNCPKKFDDDKSKFAVKANHQLVATAQAKQGACPISGREIDDSKEVTIKGAKVKFCCDNCKGKTEKATGDDQLKLVFSDEAWEKGKFEVKK
jgi:YHS domain-containing protein